jgi:HK97 gp10 family phage protein
VIRWDDRLARNITSAPEVAGPAGEALLRLGWEVAEAAARGAPPPSGMGAKSIHPELVLVDGVPEVRVSWDRRHFYLGFSELGTVHQPPRPFLRPALNHLRR